MEYIILKLFGKKILAFFFSKFKGKLAKKYKGYKKLKYNRKFVELLDMDILNKYGDKKIYDNLSKLIVCDDILNKIYNRCYSIDNNNYQTDEEFLEELISGREYEVFNKVQIKEVLKNIFDSVFYVLNQAEDDETRKIINAVKKTEIFLHSIYDEVIDLKRDIKNIEIKDNPRIEDQTIETKFFSEPVLQCYKDNREKCDITLNSNGDNPLFKILLKVKSDGQILKFKSSIDYMNYLSFTGKEAILDVVEIKIERIEDGKVYFDFEKECYETTISFPALNVYSIEQFPRSEEATNMDMKIKIIPPNTQLKVCVENENGESIFDLRVYELTRNILSNGDLEVTMNDVSNDKDVEIMVKSIFRNKKEQTGEESISSEVTISNNMQNTAHGRFRYYNILKRIKNSKQLIYRDKNTGICIFKGKSILKNINDNYITNQIIIYGQLIKIQDYFNVVFKLPDKMDIPLIDTIRQVFELITCKKTIIDKYDLTFKKADLTLKKKNDSKEELKENSIIGIVAELNYIQLLGKKLKFHDMRLIAPGNKLSEITNDSYKFETISLGYIILNKNIKELDISEPAKVLLGKVIEQECDCSERND